MTVIPGLLTVLIISAMLTDPRCEAEELPPPTELSYKWLNGFTVDMSWSWQKPSTLPKECKIKYWIHLVGKPNTVEIHNWQTVEHQHSISSAEITENTASDQWEYTVQSITDSCRGWNNSTIVTKTIKSRKQRANLVKDFKCMYADDSLNCSWIPLNPSVDLSLSYKGCGQDEQHLKACGQPFRSGERTGCILQTSHIYICILMNTTSEWDVFKARIVTQRPQLNITEDNNQLVLKWSPPQLKQLCKWIYEFRYTECNVKKPGQNVSIEKPEIEAITRVPYDKNCLYNFSSRLLTGDHCPEVISEWNGNVTYGENKPQDRTLTLVTIIVPIIVFVCFILSCYCFRKYSSIICPDPLYPPLILKDMMDRNKEHKPPNVYVPNPEESSKITLISKSGELQPNT